MEAKTHNSQTKEAKIIQLYPEGHSTSNYGSFTCPAVNLIQALSAEIKVLKELITKQNYSSKEKIDNSDLIREYKICRSTAANWRNTGLSYTKIGAKFYYTRESIDKFMEQHKEKAF